MSDATCEKFVAHAWKKQLCANCMKAQKLHPWPVPAKRPPKPTPESPGSSALKNDLLSIISSLDQSPEHQAQTKSDVDRDDNSTFVKNECFFASAGIGEQTEEEEQKEARIVSAQKPKPASKPQNIRPKPSKDKPRVAVERDGTQTVDKSVTNNGAEMEQRPVEIDMMEQSGEEAEVFMRSSKKGKGALRSSQRPLAPPPQVPCSKLSLQPDQASQSSSGDRQLHDPQLTCDEELTNSQPPKECSETKEDKPSCTASKGGSHYYHKYDVSGSLTRKAGSSKPSLFDKHKDRLQDGKHAANPPSNFIDIGVAVPYTVVDVTTDQKLNYGDEHPPRLPDTPPPERDGGESIAAPRWSPGPKESSLRKHGSPEPGMSSQQRKKPDKGQGDDTMERCRSQPKDVVDSPVMPGVLTNENKSVSKSPHNPRRAPTMMAPQSSPTYEPIDPEDDLEREVDGRNPSEMSPGFNRHIASRTSTGKSSAMEAKIAVLANLNLGAKPAKVADIANAAESVEDSSPAPLHPPRPQVVPSKVAAEPPSPKVEKAKKSGRSFFKKLLKIGNKEPHDANMDILDGVSVKDGHGDVTQNRDMCIAHGSANRWPDADVPVQRETTLDSPAKNRDQSSGEFDGRDNQEHLNMSPKPMSPHIQGGHNAMFAEVKTALANRKTSSSSLLDSQVDSNRPGPTPRVTNAPQSNQAEVISERQVSAPDWMQRTGSASELDFPPKISNLEREEQMKKDNDHPQPASVGIPDRSKRTFNKNETELTGATPHSSIPLKPVKHRNPSNTESDSRHPLASPRTMQKLNMSEPIIQGEICQPSPSKMVSAVESPPVSKQGEGRKTPSASTCQSQSGSELLRVLLLEPDEQNLSFTKPVTAKPTDIDESQKKEQNFVESVTQALSIATDVSIVERAEEGCPQPDLASPPQTGTRRKRRPKSDGTKLERKMMPAPPPPPPVSPDSCKSPLHLSSDHLAAQNSPHSMHISPPIALVSADGLQVIHPCRSTSLQENYKAATDDMILKRRMDSSTKHARNKTVSEGMALDADCIPLDRTHGDHILAELLDKRNIRFVNRALPAPPKAGEAMSRSDMSSPEDEPQVLLEDEEIDEADNTYELVSLDGRKSLLDSERAEYEDIDDDDIYSDPLEPVGASSVGDISSLAPEAELVEDNKVTGAPSREVGVSSLKVTDEGLLVRIPSNDYLAPVTTDQDTHEFIEYEMKDGSNQNASKASLGDLREATADVGASKPERKPRPKPRASPKPHEPAPEIREDHSLTSYTNAEANLCQQKTVLTMRDCIAKMSLVSVDTLRELSKKMLHKATCSDWVALPCSDLKWADFALPDKEPMLICGDVVFYRARTGKLQPHDCVLMISGKQLSPGWAEQYQPSLNMLTVTCIFSDRIPSAYFSCTSPSPGVSDYQFCGPENATVVVLPYQRVQGVEQWLEERDEVFSSNLTAFERDSCLCLIQVLSGVLASLEGPCCCQRSRPCDIIIATSGSSWQHCVILGDVVTKTIKRFTWERICRDTISLLFVLLKLDLKKSRSIDMPSQIPVRTKFSRGLRCFVQLLQGENLTAFVQGRLLLECMLWGPQEAEVKSLTPAEDKEHGFQMWLEMKRAEVVSQCALGSVESNVDLYYLIDFLCKASGSSLQQMTQMLYNSPVN